MADVQVTCITKPYRDSQHEAITHLGGATWRWTRQEVVNSIKAETNTFFTLVNGKRADVGVVDGRMDNICGHTPTMSGTTTFWHFLSALVEFVLLQQS